jgi:hypothetical protein
MTITTVAITTAMAAPATVTETATVTKTATVAMTAAVANLGDRDELFGLSRTRDERSSRETGRSDNRKKTNDVAHDLPSS